MSLNGQFAYDSQNRIIYGTAMNSIAEINANTNMIVGTIQLSQNPMSVAFDQKDSTLYFTAGGWVTALRIQANGSFQVAYNQSGFGLSVGPIVYDQKSNNVYIAALNRNTTGVISRTSENFIIIDAGSPNKIVGNVTVASDSPSLIMGPIIYNSKNGYIYGIARSVGEDGGGSARTFVFDSATNEPVPIQNSSLGPENFPDSLAFNSDNGIVYIAPSWYCGVMGVSTCNVFPGENVSVIQSTSELSPVQINEDPNSTLTGIAYDSKNNMVYVANGTVTEGQSNLVNLTSFDAATGRITGVSSLPSSISSIYVDEANNDLYFVSSSATFVYSTG